jgi:adenylate kinase family enzyme
VGAGARAARPDRVGVHGRRVTVAGISGSGKTTTSRDLAARLGVPHIELDALHHGPGWTEATADELRARVRAALEAAPGGWVVDGNYRRKLGTLVLQRADTFVWLDLPLHVCLRRLWRRTWGRILRREELWNGNRETLRNTFLIRDSLFSWAIKRHRVHRREFPAVLAAFPHLRVVRLRSAAAVERWLGQLSSTSPTQ